jgi:hypothetical protein
MGEEEKKKLPIERINQMAEHSEEEIMGSNHKTIHAFPQYSDIKLPNQKRQTKRPKKYERTLEEMVASCNTLVNGKNKASQKC